MGLKWNPLEGLTNRDAILNPVVGILETDQSLRNLLNTHGTLRAARRASPELSTPFGQLYISKIDGLLDSRLMYMGLIKK